MSRKRAAIPLSDQALREFEDVESRDWAEGLPLGEFLKVVNRVAQHFLPKGSESDCRVSRMFTLRSFRHYQTLGCIDAPERAGKQVMYRFHHFAQALVVRRLLWERVDSERLVALMAGRSTEDTKRMLFDGVEIVSRHGAGEGASSDAVAPAVGHWRRIAVASGVELHLSEDLPKLKPKERRELLAKLETALRGQLG